MQILSNGYKLPETGDFGDEWFPALEDNITRLNGHTHNGVDSAPIPSVTLIATTATLLAAAFAPIGDQFEASVTIPSGGLVDSTNIGFRDPTTKSKIHLEIEKTSISQFKVYTSFVQDFEVIYS